MANFAPPTWVIHMATADQQGGSSEEGRRGWVRTGWEGVCKEGGVSDFSGKPWRNCPRMGHPHGDPQTSPQHADPHACLVWSSLERKTPKSIWIGVLWAGLRVAMWITHMGGKFHHGLLEKSLIFARENFKRVT